MDADKVDPQTVMIFESDTGWDAHGRPEIARQPIVIETFFMWHLQTAMLKEWRKQGLTPCVGTRNLNFQNRPKRILWRTTPLLAATARNTARSPDADVRQWIAEGRLNTESRVKAESDAEFRALAPFPEFASARQARRRRRSSRAARR